jgi:hypothetical protein
MGKRVKNTQKSDEAGEDQSSEGQAHGEDNSQKANTTNDGAAAKTGGEPSQSLQLFVSGLPYESNDA